MVQPHDLADLRGQTHRAQVLRAALGVLLASIDELADVVEQRREADLCHLGAVGSEHRLGEPHAQERDRQAVTREAVARTQHAPHRRERSRVAQHQAAGRHHDLLRPRHDGLVGPGMEQLFCDQRRHSVQHFGATLERRGTVEHDRRQLGLDPAGVGLAVFVLDVEAGDTLGAQPADVGLVEHRALGLVEHPGPRGRVQVQRKRQPLVGDEADQRDGGVGGAEFAAGRARGHHRGHRPIRGIP